MRIHDVCHRASLDLKRAVYRAEIRKYDEVIGIAREDSNNYRIITDRQYASLIKALLMKDVGFSTPTILAVLEGDKDRVHGAVAEISGKIKKLRTLKEIL